MFGEFAGGWEVAVVFGEGGEVIAGDAAVVEGGALVAGAKEGFCFGEMPAFDEEGAKGAMEGEGAGRDLECFTYAELGGRVEVGFILHERDAGELIEEGDFLTIGKDVVQNGGALVFETTVVLKHHGLELFPQDRVEEARLQENG